MNMFLLAQVLTSLVHIDSQLKELHSNFTFHPNTNNTLIEPKLNHLLHTHLTTLFTFSTIIWSSFLTLLIIILITRCLLFMYFYHCRLYGFCCPINQFMNVIFNKPLYAFEDELTYITQNCIVHGSASTT